MLIEKDQVLSLLDMHLHKYERVKATLQVDLIKELRAEIERLEETPPQFYLVNMERGKKCLKK